MLGIVSNGWESPLGIIRFEIVAKTHALHVVFERVRKAYLERAAASPQRFKIIDASRDQEDVWLQVETALKAGLGL